MINKLYIFERTTECFFIQEAGLYEIYLSTDFINVPTVARRKVIYDAHARTALAQGRRNMRAYETGSARYQNYSR
jgi:hypothetical protein